ncbi:AraC family transcriptional regulator [Algoriphagus sp. H41]|uniref:AraC family transcriptional regulator n=1 Tax=Algoriphagus oliviformis TaxID=2811231 RepID=A0ABS3C8C5_9BACT|nr:AraC family transcriptional regulator [Algoriphagus oliviformis]MBN7813365.1 AraC family transcriptional regulator [Algoriphagus oliviformis]
MKPVLEPIPLEKNQSILAFCFNKKNFETPWHFHPQFELTWIASSTGTKFIGDFIGNYEPGELVLLHSNLPHYWKNGQNQADPATSYVIQWNGDAMPHAPEMEAIHELLQASSRGILFDQVQAAAIFPLIQKSVDLSGASLYLQLLTILSALTACSYSLLSESGFTKAIPLEYSSRLEKVHEFVANQYGRKIYLKEVSELANMSEQAFSRFFSKMAGRPFFVFLNDYRIHTAARMLLEKDDPIAQIAQDCGYESLPFFHRKFNEAYGTSPARHRKIHQSKP